MQVLDIDAIERRMIEGEPLIVLAEMPSPLRPEQKAQDVVVRDSGIAFLLSHPACFVILIGLCTRRQLDKQLEQWLDASPQFKLAQEPKYRQLATHSPMRWSFLTLDELINPISESALREHAKIAKLTASQGLFDPTGVRSLLHLLVFRRVAAAPSPDLPPLFAVVADDETDTAQRHGYLVRRLGYSTLVVDSPELWALCAEPDGAWRADSTYDLALFDNIMDFDGPRSAMGSDALNRLPARIKIVVTGAGDSSLPHSMRKPLLDAHHFLDQERVWRNDKNAVPIWNVLCGPSIGISPQVEDSLAPGDHVVKPLREIGLRLFRIAKQLEAKGADRAAAIHYLEVYLLLKGRDGSAAAKAFAAFEVIEVRSACEDYLGTGEGRLWIARKLEIERGIVEGFNEVYKREGAWWRARVFKAVERVMRESLASGSVLREAENGIRQARTDLCRSEGKWLKWASLSLWNLVSRALNSIGVVLWVWLGSSAVFFCLYWLFGGVCANGVAWDWPHWVRGFAAALSGGTGLLLPHETGLCLPHDLQLVAGLLHRLISILLFARLLELFFNRARGRSEDY
ncbi:MAG: hypothetical protein P4K98_00755 [Bryobacteraceae bacterium]|nr:hypothetical protein [Bryobacteraceae bacterium]